MGNCAEPEIVHDGREPTKQDKMNQKLERMRNLSIDAELKNAMTAEAKVVKVLMLGAAESGKSTIVKQMNILHKGGFSEEEKQQYKILARKNTVNCARALCTACRDLNISFASPDIKESQQLVDSYSAANEPHPLLSKALLTIWHDRGVQLAATRGSEFNLLDSAPYFFENAERIFAANFAPTLQDILRTRLATTGIIETSFMIENVTFKVVDVGGQRGQRHKWIRCFDAVNAIMWVASLSEYDQVLAEDKTRNRMMESLALFEGIINLPWFRHTPVILFLNKHDIFMNKIKRVDLGVYFPEYTGGAQYETALEFIRDAYFALNHAEHKNIYCHVTNATDTSNIDFVWAATRHMILEQNLHVAGILPMG